MAGPNEPDKNDNSEIPPLTSISPSIFVPTDRDFTKAPPPLSDDSISLLEASIESLDWHAERVERNMVSMLTREAERIRRAGRVERVRYDVYHRPVKEQHNRKDNELRFEEMILRADSEAVADIVRDINHLGDAEDAPTGGGRQQQQQSHGRRLSLPPARSSRGPEYMDLATIRSEKMFRADVDEFRQTPRSAALVYVLNLVKWGWDEQLEGHKARIKREKEELRANLHRHVKENPLPFATTGPSATTTPAAVPPPQLPHDNLAEGDPMDVDK